MMRGTLAILVVIVAASAWLYGYRLEYAPPHLEIDEVLIGLDAHAIASTGRDLRGERLPLYSQTAEHSWYQPLVIYLTALTLKVLPFSESSVRMPTICLAVVDIVLIYSWRGICLAAPCSGPLPPACWRCRRHLHHTVMGWTTLSRSLRAGVAAVPGGNERGRSGCWSRGHRARCRR
jgi:4-amino-4-deoxy-L-arabinose transferase-like glycosyltransferase